MKKRKPQVVATAYYWPSVYAVVKASSDQAVKQALKRFGVEKP